MSNISVSVGDDDGGEKTGFLVKAMRFVGWVLFLLIATPIVLLAWDTVTGNEDDGLFAVVDRGLNEIRDSAREYRASSVEEGDEVEAEEVDQGETEAQRWIRYRKLGYSDDDLTSMRYMNNGTLPVLDYTDRQLEEHEKEYEAAMQEWLLTKDETDAEQWARMLKKGFTQSELEYLAEQNGGRLKRQKRPRMPRTHLEVERALRADPPSYEDVPKSANSRFWTPQDPDCIPDPNSYHLPDCMGYD